MIDQSLPTDPNAHSPTALVRRCCTITRMFCCCDPFEADLRRSAGAGSPSAGAVVVLNAAAEARASHLLLDGEKNALKSSSRQAFVSTDQKQQHKEAEDAGHPKSSVIELAASNAQSRSPHFARVLASMMPEDSSQPATTTAAASGGAAQLASTASAAAAVSIVADSEPNQKAAEDKPEVPALPGALSDELPRSGATSAASTQPPIMTAAPSAVSPSSATGLSLSAAALAAAQSVAAPSALSARALGISRSPRLAPLHGSPRLPLAASAGEKSGGLFPARSLPPLVRDVSSSTNTNRKEDKEAEQPPHPQQSAVQARLSAAVKATQQQTAITGAPPSLPAPFEHDDRRASSPSTSLLPAATHTTFATLPESKDPAAAAEQAVVSPGSARRSESLSQSQSTHSPRDLYAKKKHKTIGRNTGVGRVVMHAGTAASGTTTATDGSAPAPAAGNTADTPAAAPAITAATAVGGPAGSEVQPIKRDLSVQVPGNKPPQPHQQPAADAVAVAMHQQHMLPPSATIIHHMASVAKVTHILHRLRALFTKRAAAVHDVRRRQWALRSNSVLCLPASHPLRSWAWSVVHSRFFDMIVFVMIVFSCVLLTLDEPGTDHNSSLSVVCACISSQLCASVLDLIRCTVLCYRH